MAQTDIALTRPDHTLSMDTLRAQMEAAKRYVDSGLLPSAIKTPQQALTIMQVGREVGVPPTYALRNVHVIEGKPTCSAELLMALVRRTYGQAAIRVADSTNELCTVEYREQGWDGVSSLTFTMDDAKKAGLATKAMWGKYPRAMLRSRAVSEAVRTAFPECIAGLYTPEEMGADVEITSDGSVDIRDNDARPSARPEVVEGTVVDRSEMTDDQLDARLAASSKKAQNGDQQPEEPTPFKYANVQARYEAAAEYERLVRVAVARGHRQAKKIESKHAKDLSDPELAGSIEALQKWEEALPAPEPATASAF